jgi:hypothetical protein
MKRELVVFFIIVCSLTFAQASKTPKENDVKKESKTEQKVIICNSKGAYAYHKGYCKGLNKFKSSTSAVTIEQAKKQGKRKPCGFC